jgi:hypothetical protein
MRIQEGYRPWTGSAFGVGDLGARRVLLLGESHYTAELQYDTPELTVSVVKQVIDGAQVIPFFDRTQALVTEGMGTGTIAPRATFWHAVAFCNYVPCLVAAAARVRPTGAMWKSGSGPFARTLEEVRPARVLVLGKSVWNHIRFPDGWRSVPLRGDEAVREWIAPHGQRIIATWVNHPSSVGFTISKWSFRASALLAAT